MMRLWSLHPRYLDRTGLVTLWREALLAQAVLLGKTRGYRHHPQLIRFRNHPTPERAIAAYLQGILCEATKRGYRFDETKIIWECLGPTASKIPVSSGQLFYERDHLLKKLNIRDIDAFRILTTTLKPIAHPFFVICEGGVEEWEKV
jgi:hypothetical protein